MWNRSFAAYVVVLLCALSFRAEAKDWKTELDQGYAVQNTKPLTEFLEAWHAESKPVSPEILDKKPAFEQDAYAIFKVLYKPNEELYKNTGYAVVQDEIAVQIVDSDLQHVFDQGFHFDDDSLNNLPSISELKVEDFRPAIPNTGKKILYYKAGHHIYTLLSFICQNDEMRYDDLLKETNQLQDRIDRVEFLNSRMKVILGHWGIGWEFATHPHIDAITFSADRKRAVAYYSVGYDLGSALLLKSTDGKWTVKEQGITGME